MKKAFCSIFVLALLFLTQVTFATENDLSSVPQPVTLIINDSDQKLINFNLDKTAILELSADPLKKTASIKLAPANRDRKILLSCNNNQQITGDQSVNCPVLSSSVTLVMLTDVISVIKKEKSEIMPIVIGALLGGSINQFILGFSTVVCVPEVGLAGVILTSVIGAVIGAGGGAMWAIDVMSN